VPWFEDGEILRVADVGALVLSVDRWGEAVAVAI
jgi:hypothetical protein